MPRSDRGGPFLRDLIALNDLINLKISKISSPYDAPFVKITCSICAFSKCNL